MRPLCLVCLPFLLAPAIQAENARTLAPLALAFIDFTKDLFKRGNDLFDTLAESQAKSVTNDVYSDARTLKEKKSVLKKQLTEGRITDQELQNRVEDLYQSAQKLGRSMEKFGSEIDRVTHLNAGPLLGRVRELSSSKLDELLDLQTAYRSNSRDRRERALQHLEKAIADMEGVEGAARCLLDTIEKKQNVCDSDLRRDARTINKK